QTETSKFYDRIERILPKDLSTIIYTSGTTGNPKGVMLSHRNILSNCEGASHVLPLGPKDLTLSFLPLSHAFERTVGFYGMLFMGSRIAYAENLTTISQNIQETHPTILFCVPRILEKIHTSIWDEIRRKPRVIHHLFSHALDLSSKKKSLTFFQQLVFKSLSKLFFTKIHQKMGGSLGYIISGGAKLNPKIATFFEQVGIPVLQGYGLTETSPIVTVNPPSDNRIGSVGTPIEGVNVKISNDGEILVKGDLIMLGYYKDQDATKEVIDENHYFHTGDIGTIDENGYLYITDRKKEIIVTSGGKKVAPQTIENALIENPLIDQACIVGEGEKYLGALLVPNFQRLKNHIRNMDLTHASNEELVKSDLVNQLYQGIVDELNQKLASYETIKKFQLLSQEFSIENDELTPTLKLRRKTILTRHGKIVESFYANPGS
ncbi:MAG: long-chain fatty acid--CoA ligase, partial [Bdellovibrionales bacterium]|nr:long-chain fatty acid--CoA ligase [Bdellovibrionales bacterium]